ncbi:MAG: cation diffusion facilitator family transporter [Micavibrio sp.]|nr:cation diffusion facilitator family transporter [Micavibrio sp.]
MASGSKKVIYAALIGNSLISVTKFTASFLTGSSAMFSEGIHSLVDTGNQGLLLYGLKAAKKPPSPNFPFGHGKEIYFWSFIVAILIFALGAGISIYEGIQHILHPNDLSDPTINYIVLGLAIIFEGFALTMAVAEFNKQRGKYSYIQAVRRGKDPSLFVVLFEDAAAMLGLFIALFGIMLTQITGNVMWDGLASIAIGGVLALTAFWLAIETKSLLIGEGADKDVVDRIKTIVATEEDIKAINEVLTLYMGPEYVLATISINFKRGLKTGRIEEIISALDKTIKEEYPFIKRIYIEAETLASPQPSA